MSVGETPRHLPRVCSHIDATQTTPHYEVATLPLALFTRFDLAVLLMSLSRHSLSLLRPRTTLLSSIDSATNLSKLAASCSPRVSHEYVKATHPLSAILDCSYINSMLNESYNLGVAQQVIKSQVQLVQQKLKNIF